MELSHIRGAMYFLRMRRAKARIRNFARNFRLAERAVFIVLRYRNSKALHKDQEVRVAPKGWRRRNESIRLLIDNAAMEFPQGKRREVRFYSQGISNFQTTLYTKNHLIGGKVYERPFSIHNHVVQPVEFKNVNFWQFKYLYDNVFIHVYEQFVNEFSDEYYGRNSEVFFTKDQSQAVGDFPLAKDFHINYPIYTILGQYYNNYWHFMMEYLPKLTLVPSGSMILMPEDLVFAPQFELISKNLKLEIVKIDPNQAFSFANLIAFTSPIKFMDSKNTSIDIRLLKKMQSKWNDLIPIIPISVGRTVFLQRKSIRRINIDGILQEFLKSNNYTLIDLSSKNFEYQKSLFSGSRLIAAYPGANWANLIYSRGKSIFVNLVSIKNVDQSLHHAIARIFNAEIHNIVLCDPEEYEALESNSYLESESAQLTFDSASAEAVIQILNHFT